MNTLQMAGHLAISRIRNARGHALLDTLAVVAFSVSSWLLLTTMGGVWMFYGRLGQLSARLEHLYGIPAHYTENMDRAYMALALLALACSLFRCCPWALPRLVSAPTVGLGGWPHCASSASARGKSI